MVGVAHAAQTVCQIGNGCTGTSSAPSYGQILVGNSANGYRDVNEAAKNIVMMDLAILQAEAAAGMYKKPVEMIAKEMHYDPLPADVRSIVIAAWIRGGWLPKVEIERIVAGSKLPIAT